MYELTGIPSTDLLASRLAATQQTTISRLQPLLPKLPGTAVFSHTTACALLGITPPKHHKLADGVHVTVADPTDRRPYLAGVIWHTWPLITMLPIVTEVSGIPCLRPEALLAQMAAHLDFEGLAIFGDSLLCRNDDLKRSSIKELRNFAAAGGAFRGKRRFKRVLPVLREDTDSPMESALRISTIQYGLPGPDVNFPIETNDRMNHADMGYPDYKIILEYDGRHHLANERQWEADWEKRNRWTAAGWHTFVATAATLRSEDAMLAFMKNIGITFQRQGVDIQVREKPLSLWDACDMRRTNQSFRL
ncbi:hypothetical protein [Bifidobacterium callimiconis]|nr:hypothetical protein [Bifidobacterium callimiconis]